MASLFAHITHFVSRCMPEANKSLNMVFTTLD